jgi:hypothetical protein
MSEQPQEDEGKCRIHGEYLDDMGDCPVCEEVCEEASRGMSEHHPSCRESDKDLVWHCSQCGLNEPASEQPEEQMAEQLHVWYLEATQALDPANYNPKAQKSYAELNEQQKEIDRYIARKINAALEAEREKVKQQMEFRQGQEDRHKQELAAERELLLRLREFTEAWNEPELTQQIDALAKVKGAK